MIIKLLIGSLIFTGAKILLYWITLKSKDLLKPKEAPIEEKLKLNKKFTSMMKEKKLKRKDILEIQRYIYKLTHEPNRGYNNECHYICHCIKHCDLSLRDLFQINMMLETKEC